MHPWRRRIRLASLAAGIALLLTHSFVWHASMALSLPASTTATTATTATAAPVALEPHLLPIALVNRSSALGLAYRIPLLAGWPPNASPALPLRTAGQACVPSRKSPALYACHQHLLILGMAKAATTALFAHLLLHPQVRAPAHKESRYFEKARFDYIRGGRFVDASAYVSVAENEKRVNVDGSPNYVGERNNNICQRLAAFLPATSRFVVILRRPVERFWSLERMEQRRKFNMCALRRPLRARAH